METLSIAITNKRLENLGLDPEDEYTDFVFNPKFLVGYWFVKDDDGIPNEICVYIGHDKFYIKYSKENVNKLNSYLKPAVVEVSR